MADQQDRPDEGLQSTPPPGPPRQLGTESTSPPAPDATSVPPAPEPPATEPPAPPPAKSTPPPAKQQPAKAQKKAPGKKTPAKAAKKAAPAKKAAKKTPAKAPPKKAPAAAKLADTNGDRASAAKEAAAQAKSTVASATNPVSGPAPVPLTVSVICLTPLSLVGAASDGGRGHRQLSCCRLVGPGARSFPTTHAGPGLGQPVGAG